MSRILGEGRQEGGGNCREAKRALSEVPAAQVDTRTRVGEQVVTLMRAALTSWPQEESKGPQVVHVPTERCADGAMIEGSLSTVPGNK
jgi:hypothetical protein